MMNYDKDRNMYIGFTDKNKCIAVSPLTLLNAIEDSVSLKEDINIVLDPNMWAYLVVPNTDIYEIDQLEDVGYSLMDALTVSDTNQARLELEEIVYTVEKLSKDRLRVVASSEQCENFTGTYLNLAMLYAGMQAQEYYNFEVFLHWYPVMKP
eukprot:GHVR01109016.1.p1 GENE.GHVR01109016.1~~GHVR01109016.1.p1  ORF type:complete len:152 (-),score=15.74 GHVR01109016.1:79-534(-)